MNPNSFYGVHKLTIENYLKVFHALEGLPYCVMRLSNPYGAYQPLERKHYGVINRFIQLASSQQPMTIFGEGCQKRDYIFVEDAIVALLLAGMNSSCHGEVFNLGGCQPISIIDVVHLLELFPNSGYGRQSSSNNDRGGLTDGITAPR